MSSNRSATSLELFYFLDIVYTYLCKVDYSGNINKNRDLKIDYLSEDNFYSIFMHLDILPF